MDIIKLDEIFLDKNYSIGALLTRTQEVSLKLSSLRDQLIQHQQDLNQTSLDLFNNSYDRFYKLSFIISCLSEPIQNLINPLQIFQSQLSEMCKKHDTYVEQTNKKLTYLEETSKNKELGSRLIGLIKRRNRIESQMKDIDWTVTAISRDVRVSASKNPALEQATCVDYKIKLDLLERINNELYHLSRELYTIQPAHNELSPIKKSLESSLKKQQTYLNTWFEDSFSKAIEKRDKELLNLIIRTYQQIDATQRLESVWRAQIVRPYLNLTLTDAQSLKQLSKTFELLDQFIKHQFDLIPAEFIIRSFWSEIVESLDKLERMYSLNEIDTFRNRYIQTKEFLEIQNNFIHQEDIRIGITGEEVNMNCKTILRKFNLKGYFNHRLAQIASSVESSLGKQPLSEIGTQDSECQSGTNLKFRLKICLKIYISIEKCWSPEFYIDSLELNFCKLTCRVINRFSNWLSKLRLSDFRITGPTAPEVHRQTNFLAKQDALMRLLIEDCCHLKVSVNEFLDKIKHSDESITNVRGEFVASSFDGLDAGLSNVRSLQKLLER